MNDDRYEIRVTVTPEFLAGESDPGESRYAFAYTVEIRNEGRLPAQLLSRHWVITDGERRVQEVRGTGVVGEQPVIAPGEAYSYTSGAVIETEVGSMQGSYRMEAEDGHQFVAEIPAFTLAARNALH